MQIDISFDYNTSFKEFAKVAAICEQPMWITAYTKKAIKVLKQYNINLELRKPMLIEYNLWHPLYINFKETKLSCIFGGFHFDDIINK